MMNINICLGKGPLDPPTNILEASQSHGGETSKKQHSAPISYFVVDSTLTTPIWEILLATRSVC